VSKAKVWGIVGIILFFVVVIIVYNWDRITSTIISNVTVYQDSTNIEPNDWVQSTSIKPEDSLNIIKVDYQEKYGSEKTAYCMCVFENSKTGEYKCVSPKLGSLVLQKSNLISFQFTIVPKTEENCK